MSKTVEGEINGVKYSIDESIVEKLKIMHNIDAIEEIKKALMKEKNEDKGITE